MKLRKTLTTSVTGLKTKKSRTFLTMLGIIIGIASVVIIMAVGAGAQSLIINQITSVGSNLVVIFPGKSDESGPPTTVLGITITTLKLEDIEALTLTRNAPNVVAATGIVQGVDTMIWRNRTYDGNYLGVSASYTEVENAPLEAGRFFNDDEDRGLARVTVLGSEVKTDLFGNVDPVGERIKIGRHSFTVIGYMEPRGSQGFSNKDTEIYVPIRTAQKLLLGINHVSLARVKIDSEANIPLARGDITTTLRERHNITDPEKDDFTVRDQTQALEILTSITDALRFFLAGIAAISLIVGGIGIMNIMLAAVTERTREIGLRKAVGAQQRDLMTQFLIEALIITFLGAAVGILIGAVVSLLVAVVARFLGYDWALVVSLQSILVAVLVSGIVGITFGIYPARKAAKLNPIEALRYE